MKSHKLDIFHIIPLIGEVGKIIEKAMKCDNSQEA